MFYDTFRWKDFSTFLEGVYLEIFLLAQNRLMLKKEIDPKLMGVNPFVENLKVLATKHSSQTDAGVLKEYEFERDKSYKVYFSHGRREMLSKLGYRPLQVWSWIMCVVVSGEDWVWLNYEALMRETSITSERTVRDSLKQLTSMGYIAPCVNYKGVFWINPARGFKGSRINKYPGKVVWE